MRPSICRFVSAFGRNHWHIRRDENTHNDKKRITTVVYEDAVHYYCNNIDVCKAYVVLVIRVQLSPDAIFTSIHII